MGISSEDDDGNETEGKVVNTKPAVKTPQPKQLSIEERFANAKKSLGEEKFFKILGEAGFQSSDDVNFLEADDVLNKMAKAYREKNVKV